MHLTEEELKQIIKEEFINLVNEEEIDEKLFSALKNIGKGLLSKSSDFMSGKPNPKASAGVGRAFARYKVPQKQPKQTGLARMGQPFSYQPDAGIEDTEWSKESEKYYDQSRFPVSKEPLQIGPHKEPIKPAPISRQLVAPPSTKEPKLLTAPGEIIVTNDIGKLMTLEDSEQMNELIKDHTSNLINTQYYNNLTEQNKEKSKKDVQFVLSYLISQKHILLNPTIVPGEKTVQNEEYRPSFNQVEIEFHSPIINSFINNVFNKFNNKISMDLISILIGFLYKEGRLAISTRLYNQYVHTGHPSIQKLKKSQQESKSYNNFYNNWKIYTGVKI